MLSVRDCGVENGGVGGPVSLFIACDPRVTRRPFESEEGVRRRI